MTNEPTVLSVSQLNRHVRTLLEYEMGDVWVEGEISNLSKPSSGHFYFTLKDAHAQIRCVYFRNRHAAGLNELESGQQVIAGGKLSIYEARGDFQLIIEELKEAGLGDLYRQFELLKNKLKAAGLFEAERKKTIPVFPNAIGIITSPSGAAIRDILSTLARRFPLADVMIYPSEVQGKQAPLQLIHAIRQANQENRVDVLLIARGGGSIEDLWAFNDEQLAYAIAESKIPTVVGVGHETDFTIADFVADMRAATPTAAAEAVTPNRQDLIVILRNLDTRLIAAITRFIRHKRLLLNHELQKITSPGQLILSHWQTLDYLRAHLSRAMNAIISKRLHQLHIARTQLIAQNPARNFTESKVLLCTLNDALLRNMALFIKHNKQKLVALKATLQAISPLATLERGYAIVTHGDKVVLNAQAVQAGDELTIQLAHGELLSEVKSK